MFNFFKLNIADDTVACRGGCGRSQASTLGGIQGASFLKIVGKKCRYRGMMQHWGISKERILVKLLFLGRKGDIRHLTQ